MPDEGISNGGGSDAASVMQATISEFNSQGGSDPSPAPAPAPAPDPPVATAEPAPVPADPTQPSAGQPADAPAPHWTDALFAEPQDRDQPDELTTLLNEEAFNGLRENPQGLLDWATKARGHLERFNQGTERERSLSAAAEHIGGWDDAPKAFDVYGDLFRGGLALEEADEAYPNASTYVDRAFLRVKEANPQVASDLSAAVLNHFPEIVEHNRDWALRRLGYDPKYADDYKRVAENGGFHVQEDQAAINKWFNDHGVPLDQLGTLRRLPMKVQHDILAGDPEAGAFHLQEYHDKFVSKDREAKVAEERKTQEAARAEYQSAQSLATEQRKVFQEYVDKGKALGLNDLEAAGLAARAWSELEESYWQDDSESRKTLDGWHGYIKGGNKLQIAGGRASYRKAFEAAYRKAGGQYQPKRAGVPPTPPGAPRQNGANNGNNQQQFDPAQPADDSLNGLTGAALMEAMLKDNARYFPGRA